ncbi:MAG: hypothetical protein ACR2PK_13820 [Acidimicrobiales bacterium]
MKRLLTLALTAAMMVLVFASPANAQDDPVIGTVTSDPASVPEAGEYTLVATGEGFIPDSMILLGACVAPGDVLVPGVSTPEEVSEAGFSIDPLADCDLDTTQSVTVDADGNFTAEWTGEVADNFFFSAGALDGSQAGAAWIPVGAVEEGGGEEGEGEEATEEPEPEPEPEPISEGEEEELANTAVNSDLVVVFGVGLLAAGTLTLATTRRRFID